MKPKPKSIDDYLDALDVDKLVALQKLRAVIQSAAPEAEECITYGLPAFRQGRILVAFGATKNHCALYPMSAETVPVFTEALRDFDTSKGTIRFQPGKPLPTALVGKIVKARIAENKRLSGK